MKNYLVVWEIEVDAETPLEAAQKALAIQRAPESTATVFQVWDDGELTNIDMEDPPEP